MPKSRSFCTFENLHYQMKLKSTVVAQYSCSMIILHPHCSYPGLLLLTSFSSRSTDCPRSLKLQAEIMSNVPNPSGLDTQEPPQEPLQQPPQQPSQPPPQPPLRQNWVDPWRQPQGFYPQQPLGMVTQPYMVGS